MESMKKPFYCLQSRIADEPDLIYGRPEWESRFGMAEWSNRVGGLSTGRLLPPYGEARSDLTIILPSLEIWDFVWTWYSDCIVTESTLSLFKHEGFTGYEARPVTVERIIGVSRRRREEVTIPPLWELLIQGKGGDAAPESGIYVIDQSEDSSTPDHSSFRNGIIVDEDNWDGSDFCTVNGYPKFILVTERVKECIMGHQLTNCALIPSHKLEWGSDIRPEEALEKDREMASRPLGSLLAELASPDVTMDTTHALGKKGDPRAVDPLIEKFDHPDPFIWHSAASAVASIAQNKIVPEQVREELFSRLTALLNHDDPLMRKSAATALGSIGGERAAQEIMRLLDDPDDSLRRKALFIMGFLRYRPALDAVSRLTRDRSKEVREMARIVVPESESEWP
jgi:hypothetical protein